jgi:hypothetical protein
VQNANEKVELSSPRIANVEGGICVIVLEELLTLVAFLLSGLPAWLPVV